MLTQCRHIVGPPHRRRPNIKTAPSRGGVFAEICNKYNNLLPRYSGTPSVSLSKHWVHRWGHLLEQSLGSIDLHL